MMAHPMPAAPLSPAAALETAHAWCQEAMSLNETASDMLAAAARLSQAADGLLAAAGLARPTSMDAADRTRSLEAVR